MDREEQQFQEALAAVRTLIRYIGDDPDRPELVETPRRVLAAYREMLSGYRQQISEISATNITETTSREAIVLAAIPFVSMCEHHLAIMRGFCHLAYLPNQQVVGISKLARLLDFYARRLQLQERLTEQLAEGLTEFLAAQGVAVLIEAEHHCLALRGANKPGAQLITRAATGIYREDAAAASIIFHLLAQKVQLRHDNC